MALYFNEQERNLRSILHHVTTDECPFCKKNSVYEYTTIRNPYEMIGFVCTCCGAITEVDMHSLRYDNGLYDLFVRIQKNYDIKDLGQNAESKAIKGPYNIDLFFAKHHLLTVSEDEVRKVIRETDIKILK